MHQSNVNKSFQPTLFNVIPLNGKYTWKFEINIFVDGGLENNCSRKDESKNLYNLALTIPFLISFYSGCE